MTANEPALLRQCKGARTTVSCRVWAVLLFGSFNTFVFRRTLLHSCATDFLLSNTTTTTSIRIQLLCYSRRMLQTFPKILEPPNITACCLAKAILYLLAQVQSLQDDQVKNKQTNKQTMCQWCEGERLSEARHHAAQGKAFALFIVPSTKYLDHREHPDQQITLILCSWIHMESLLTDQVLNHLTDQEQSWVHQQDSSTQRTQGV